MSPQGSSLGFGVKGTLVGRGVLVFVSRGRLCTLKLFALKWPMMELQGDWPDLDECCFL